MKKGIYLLLLTGSTLTASATQPDTLSFLRLGLTNELRQAEWQNPALYGEAYMQSFTELKAQMTYQKMNRAFLQQQGNGIFHPQVEVTTFVNTGKAWSTWGGASYLNGLNRNILWNSISDYQRLRPYVLADTLGGDTRTERYSFYGGYAQRAGRWKLGAGIHYRASQEYRDIDPRMRSIVSDLNAKLGASYRIGNYQLGAATLLNIYKQSCSVDFYKEAGVVPEYLMTGLASCYQRFSGDNRNLNYKGHAHQILLNLIPISETGWFTNLDLKREKYRQTIVSLNHLPLTTQTIESGELEAGWRQTSAQFTAFRMVFNGYRRIGKEHVAGGAENAGYPVIHTLAMYKEHYANIFLQALYGKKGLSYWQMSGQGGMECLKMNYAYPGRSLRTRHAYGKLSGILGTRVGKRWSLTTRMDVLYKKGITSSIDLPYANMPEEFREMARENYAFLKADQTHLQLTARADYLIDKALRSLFIQAGGGKLFTSADRHQTLLDLTLGTTF